jgi:hypothetical protein
VRWLSYVTEVSVEFFAVVACMAKGTAFSLLEVFLVLS